MKINFTKKEYGLLLEMLAIADWVMNAHSTTDHPDTRKYSDLEQKLFSFADEMGYDELILFDKESGKYYPTSEHDEIGEHRKFIEEFEEESFWSELVSKLATRDFLNQVTQQELETMPRKEQMNKLFELEEWYEDEIDEHGLDSFKLDKAIKTKMH